MNHDKILNAFPNYVRQDVEIVINAMKNRQLDTYTSNQQEIILDIETLVIPYRIDVQVESSNHLTDLQQNILHCLYLRHHDGFIRQKSLEKLIYKNDSFIVPFVFQLLGEYVIEILELANQHINENTMPHYLKFKAENPVYWQQTKSRMISYWNEYYRKNHPKLNDYIGKQIFSRLENHQKLNNERTQ